MAQVKRLAGQYAPEWRYEPGAADPGAAIAELFGEMFYQTIDRFNQAPLKTYVEYLSLLGVMPPTVTPAYGYVAFEVGGASDTPVIVPEGTEVFVKSDDGNIVYETQRQIGATGANLEDIYFVDVVSGRIEKAAKSGDIVFFDTAGRENLQKHRFALSQNEVLNLGGPCAIDVTLRQGANFLEERTAKRLTDPGFASWKYWNGSEYRAFDRVTADGSALRLEKDSGDSLASDDEGHICVYCDITGGEGEIKFDGLLLRSHKPGARAADAISNNDIPISQADGGYCFGRRPAMYQMFYIKSNETFVKRGANVNVSLDISPIVTSDVSDEPQYEFKRRVIDKSTAVRLTTDDVFVEQVVWEYYNGAGWAPLDVTGDTNPFSGKSAKSTHELVFTVPQDMASVLINAELGYYIRCRVINVENFLSPLPRWILPFVKSVRCGYQYTGDVPVDYICAYNNNKKTWIDNAAGISDLRFTVFSPMPPNPRAMYLRFDRSVHAMPLSIFFEIRGEDAPYSKISCEVWVKNKFLPCRTIDTTSNLRHTGAMFMYITQPLTEAEFFGENGFWLRMSLSSNSGEVRRAARVSAMHLNTVSAVQRRRAPEQFFNTGPYEAGKIITLLEKPVLNCELWVDEIGGLSVSELNELEAGFPDKIRPERENNELKRCWVRWDEIPSIRQAGENERVYELDSFSGEITFGKGSNGKVPPGGDLNIHVKYSYGGGAAGNCGIGAVSALIGSIPRINGVMNVTPMSGGTDRPDMEKVEKLGNKRLRHRFVPMSAEDYEEITLEKFQRAALVKCFPGTDENGARAKGHVCLVVMGKDMDGGYVTRELCRDIYAYLSERCDCNLVAGGRLHVVPSVEMTINVEAHVMLANLDKAAVTQQEISDGIARLINDVWRMRDIGDQIDLGEIYQTVKATPNVSAITRILPEGRYMSGGYERLTALDGETSFPFATVKNGVHIVRIG